MQYVTPSFARATPQDREVIAFAQYTCLGIIHATVRVNPNWLTVHDVLAPTTEELNNALATTGIGATRLPDGTGQLRAHPASARRRLAPSGADGFLHGHRAGVYGGLAQDRCGVGNLINASLHPLLGLYPM